MTPPSTVTTADREDRWTTVIRPSADRWFDLRLDELWRYRDLVLLLVRRDFVARYKQTVLGPAWHFINPIMTTVVFTIVFGRIAGIPTDGIPPFLFYFAGTTIWNYFQKALTSTSNTFVANAGLFGKVYFPRLAVPVSQLISNLISFGIQFVVFLGFLAWFIHRGAPVDPNAWVLATPLLLVLMAGIGLGAGVIASAATSKYRDVGTLIGYGTSLLMYFTPVIYPLSTVPEGLRPLMALNPLTAVVEAFRYAFLGQGTLEPWMLAYSGAVGIGLLLVGLPIFHRVERTFMDTV